MIRIGGIGCLCMLSALAFSALAAPSASAEGTTAVTCESTEWSGGFGTFSDAHCKAPQPEGGSFEHVTFANSTTTEGTLTNESTGGERVPARLKATVAGLNLTLEAKKVSASLSIENHQLPVLGTMWVEGSTSAVIFEEVTANVACTVTGLPGGVGKIETKPLIMTTLGQGDGFKLEPQKETKFAEFELSGELCPAALKGKYPVLGTVRSSFPFGATASFSHTGITIDKSLKLKTAEGPVAGLEATITPRARDPKNLVTGEWPLAFTTL